MNPPLMDVYKEVSGGIMELWVVDGNSEEWK
jgi:hypothetical protein